MKISPFFTFNYFIFEHFLILHLVPSISFFQIHPNINYYKSFFLYFIHFPFLCNPLKIKWTIYLFLFNHLSQI